APHFGFCLFGRSLSKSLKHVIGRAHRQSLAAAHDKASASAAAWTALHCSADAVGSFSSLRMAITSLRKCAKSPSSGWGTADLAKRCGFWPLVSRSNSRMFDFAVPEALRIRDSIAAGFCSGVRGEPVDLVFLVAGCLRPLLSIRVSRW